MITFEQWLKDNNFALPEATVSAPEETKECPKCGDPIVDGECPSCGEEKELPGAGLRRRGKPGKSEILLSRKSKKSKK